MKPHALAIILASTALAAGAGLVTYGSTFTAFAQVVIGPPSPTTIAAVPSLLGYGSVITWEAPDHPDITGFSIERYKWEGGVWSPATTITISDRTARSHVDMCGMGRFAYRVQATKSE